MPKTPTHITLHGTQHRERTPTATWGQMAPDAPEVAASSHVTMVEILSIAGALGEGGMGMVHAAQQATLGRLVAVKRLRYPTPRGAQTLLREARITARLQHPGIVPIHGIVEDPITGPGVVMKCLEGSTWRQVIRQGGALQEPVRHAKIAMALCQTLEFAHSQSVFHLDLKPTNVILGDFGEAVLVDWGIALDLADEGPRGKICGTPAYMAPEMVYLSDDLPIAAASDVYLLGACLYEALFHRPPHALRSPTASMAASNKPVDFPELPSSAISPLVDIVVRALAVDPAERFASAAEMGDALETFVHRFESSRQLERLRVQLDSLDDVADLRHAESQLSVAENVMKGTPLALDVRQAIDGMWIRRYLDDGAVAAAEARLAQMIEPDPMLRERVGEARREEDDAREELARIRKTEQDLAGYTHLRTLAIGAFALVMLIMSARRFMGERPAHASPTFGLIFLTMVVVGSVLSREQIRSSAINRMLAQVLITGGAAIVLFRTIAIQEGIGWDAPQRMEMVMFAALAAVHVRFHPTMPWILGGWSILIGAALVHPPATGLFFNGGLVAMFGAFAIHASLRGRSTTST